MIFDQLCFACCTECYAAHQLSVSNIVRPHVFVTRIVNKDKTGTTATPTAKPDSGSLSEKAMKDNPGVSDKK